VSESLAQGGHWHLRPYSEATVQTRTYEDGFTVEHDGFARLRGIGRHTRTATVDERDVSVVDALDGRGTVTVDWLWHFHPRFAPVADDGTAASDGAVRVECRCAIPSGAPHRGRWHTYPHSAAYGQRSAAQVLRLTATVPLPFSIETRFNLFVCAA
jgi:hypothetical protein